MATLPIVLPVFLVIAVGWALRVAGFLDRGLADALNRLVFYVAAPVLLFRGAAVAPIGQSVHLPALLLIMGLTIAFAFAVYLLLWRQRPARRGVLAQGAHRSNMVFMGLPIVIYAYGDEALAGTAVLIGVMVMLYNVLAVFVLVLPHQELSSRDPQVWRATLRQILRNPLIVACAAGILAALVRLPIPVAVDRALDLVGRTALPVALLAVGAGLEFTRLRAEIPAALGISLLKLVVYPAIVWLGLTLLGVEGRDLAIPVVLMASPTAVVSFVMARQMGGDEQLAGAVVIGTTAASLATFLGWLAVLGL